jgi:hypothetical protein
MIYIECRRDILMMKKMIVFLVFLGWTAVPPWGMADDIRVTSTLDKRSVQVDEEIHLTLRITGAQGNIQAPRLPGFKGFDTYYTGRASHITFVNNASTTSVEFSYVLVPKVAGRFTLEPIEVAVEGRVFRTDPIEIEVLGAQGKLARPVPTGPPPARLPPAASVPPPVQEPPPSFQPEDENLFVKAWVDKVSVYPNEQVLLTYSLYTRYDTRYEGFREEPEISGFWIEEFPMEREIARETVRVNGKRYVKADVRKIALFPTAPAEYTIQPGILKASIRQEPESTSIFDEFFSDSFFSGSGFFSRRENRFLKPPPIHLVVKPFPEQGKPAHFHGAVGNFRISASVDKKQVKQNEPVTVQLVIEGEGNIETLKQPDIPELESFKVYESDTSSQLFKTGNVIGGRKTFEIVFIPTKAGTVTIPKLSFSFFSPQKEAYQTISTPDFSIQVEASKQPFQIPESLGRQEIFKKEIQLEKHDIRYISEKLSDVTQNKIWEMAYRGLVAADIGLSLLVLLGLWQERRDKIFAKDAALKRRRLAKTIAESRIRRLKTFGRLRERSHAEAYFEEIDKILTRYLSDKFNLSALGTTRMDLEGTLAEMLGPEDSLHLSILELYKICDEARFGKGEPPPHLRGQALKILRQTISRVEKIRR